jgi:hypothetical protein
MSPPSSGSKCKPSKKPGGNQMASRDAFSLGLFFGHEDGGDMFL